MEHEYPMINQLFFFALLCLIVQRSVELKVAQRNTKALLNLGAIEFGKNHYWVLVTLHTLYFLSLIVEASLRKVQLSPYWPILLTVFLAAQLARIWIIQTMKGRWTTRIIVLPGRPLVTQGLFRFIPHPNYMIVAIEILFLPLIFYLYWTAILFSIFNALLLITIRIPEEERALKWALKQSLSKDYR